MWNLKIEDRYTAEKLKMSRKVPALIIIDMHPCCDAAKDRATVQSILREIKQAKRFNHIIFLVEMIGCGETDKNILDVLKNYKRKTFKITKREDDGSLNIVQCIINNGLSLSKLKICGINTNACVSSTVNGLIRRFDLKIPVEIIADACNTEYRECHSALVRNFSKQKNVKIRGRFY